MSRYLVTSRTPQFRRAGMCFTRTATLVDADVVGAERMAAILAEPALVAVEVKEDGGGEAKGEGEGGVETEAAAKPKPKGKGK